MHPVSATDSRVLAVVKRGYKRIIEPDESGTFVATILEFPGCITQGETGAEAMANLEELFPEFVATCIELGLSIPEPLGVDEYSGKITIRILPSLHKAAARRAALEHVSLNRVLSDAVARYVGFPE